MLKPELSIRIKKQIFVVLALELVCEAASRVSEGIPVNVICHWRKKTLIISHVITERFSQDGPRCCMSKKKVFLICLRKKKKKKKCTFKVEGVVAYCVSHHELLKINTIQG